MKFFYKADTDKNGLLGCLDLSGHWKSPSSMRRNAFRITLKITDIRIERIQDITEADAIAEGAFFTDHGKTCFHSTCADLSQPGHVQRVGWAMRPTTSYEQCFVTPRIAVENTWNKINGAESWERNDWVFVYTFEIVEVKK
jgi:hypothetical protein